MCYATMHPQSYLLRFTECKTKLQRLDTVACRRTDATENKHIPDSTKSNSMCFVSLPNTNRIRSIYAVKLSRQAPSPISWRALFTMDGRLKLMIAPYSVTLLSCLRLHTSKWRHSATRVCRLDWCKCSELLFHLTYIFIRNIRHGTSPWSDTAHPHLRPK